MKALFDPHIGLLQPAVYLTEIFFTVCLTVGVLVRLAGLIAVLFTAQLWLGLYNDPTEWPWTYIGIIVSHGMFVAVAAGRSLGLDNLLRLSRLVARPRLRRLLEWASGGRALSNSRRTWIWRGGHVTDVAHGAAPRG